MTDRRHRQLAALGYFPPPIRGEYQAATTIAGMFRYFRELKQTKSGKTRYEDARARREERKDEIEARQVIPGEVVYRAWENILLMVRSRVLQIPSKVESRCALPTGAKKILDESVDDALRELAKEIIYVVKESPDSDPDSPGESPDAAGPAEDK